MPHHFIERRKTMPMLVDSVFNTLDTTPSGCATIFQIIDILPPQRPDNNTSNSQQENCSEAQNTKQKAMPEERAIREMHQWRLTSSLARILHRLPSVYV